jgi:tetratricopeptide (TPR) repeat protein
VQQVSESLLAAGFRLHKFMDMGRQETLRILDQAVNETRDGQYLRAIERFESCLSDAAEDLSARQLVRLRSYYGLCVALVWGRTTRPAAWCKAALKGGAAHPDLYHNLALVLLRANQRDEAISYLLKGQRLDPEHAGIRATFQRLTPRRQPIFSFLGRQNALNRCWGLVRSRVLRASPNH